MIVCGLCRLYILLGWGVFLLGVTGCKQGNGSFDVAKPSESMGLPIEPFSQEDISFKGGASQETDVEKSAAIRRFQIMRGLRVTGKLDRATVLAMRVEQTFQIREVLPESDKRFLDRVEDEKSADLEPVAALEQKKESQAPQKPEESVVIPSSEAVEKGGTPNSEVEVFIRQYLQAAELKDSAAEFRFFAPKTNYFGKNGISGALLKKELAGGRSKWAMRRFQLRSFGVGNAHSSNSLTVKFTVRYQGLEDGRRVTGLSNREAVLVRSAEGAFKILSLYELPEGVGESVR
jgi:hypothetical protein